ncbi:MAG TPA: YXWGXW repeat-containing protein [Alphaproteobacteria bacterium]|nr:YXWGXW repeat-containing protein [Alphaproteobacteria bacterium]
MTKYSLLLGAAVAALFCACQPAAAQLDLNVTIGVPPPPVIVEPVPAPRVGFLWAPGYWYWNGGRHVWYPGHWEAERPGELFVGAQWVATPGGWRFAPAHWEHRHHHEGPYGGPPPDFCPPGQAKKGRC